MSEKQVPTWRETKGETNGVPWRLRTMRVGCAEVSLGEGFGDGVRVGMTLYRPDGDLDGHANDASALRAAADMLRTIADEADDFGAYLRGLAEDARKAAPGEAS